MYLKTHILLIFKGREDDWQFFSGTESWEDTAAEELSNWGEQHLAV